MLIFFTMAAVGGAAAPQVEAAGVAAPDQPVEGVPAPPTPLNISPNPTADEFQVWVDSGLTTSPIADWAKLSGDKLDALLEMFDVEATDHVRFIAVISKKDYDDAVLGITLNGRPVGIGFKPKASLFWHGCRFAAGMADPPPQPVVHQTVNNNFAAGSSDQVPGSASTPQTQRSLL